MTILEAVRADITTLQVDCIVNAANPSLLGGGGVDGAIHKAAGRGLAMECEAIPEVEPGVRCPTGEVRITSAHLLKCKNVIHAVGPVWDDQNPLGCDHLLAACYRNIIRSASLRSLRTVAIPCISTGAYGYSTPRAAQIAVSTVKFNTSVVPGIEKVTFVCFDEFSLVSYQQMLRSCG